MEEIRESIAKDEKERLALWAILDSKKIPEIAAMLPNGKFKQTAEDTCEVRTEYKRRSKRIDNILGYLRKMSHVYVVTNQYEGPRTRRA